jgi:hypothetical protein
MKKEILFWWNINSRQSFGKFVNVVTSLSSFNLYSILNQRDKLFRELIKNCFRSVIASEKKEKFSAAKWKLHSLTKLEPTGKFN